jgi:hypothetical protein
MMKMSDGKALIDRREPYEDSIVSAAGTGYDRVVPLKYLNESKIAHQASRL